MTSVGNWYAYAAILVSGIALFFAIRNYQRKAGAYLRGAFCIAQSRACDDRYVSEVVIENQKDRAISIFDIYLKVGYSVYIHIESFDEAPLILRPFEIYQKRFGPIEFYGFNMRRIDANELLANKKIRKRLVLSTSIGKYVVSEAIFRWNPVIEHFENHWTAILRPIPSRFKGADLGSNIRFVVEMISLTGSSEVIPIGKGDQDIRVFKNFQLTEASLKDKEALELYLLEQQIDGALVCSDLKVYDVDVWRKQLSENYRQHVSIKEDSFLRYHVLGRVGTWMSNWSLRRKNRKIHRVSSRQ